MCPLARIVRKRLKDSGIIFIHQFAHSTFSTYSGCFGAMKYLLEYSNNVLANFSNLGSRMFSLTFSIIDSYIRSTNVLQNQVQMAHVVFQSYLQEYLIVA